MRTVASVAEPMLHVCGRNYEDAYTDPGSPASRRTSLGTYVLAMVDGQKKLLMQGNTVVDCHMYQLLVVSCALARWPVSDCRVTCTCKA